MCIDEGRVTSKSKRNQFKIRNPDKPIRMGWTINKLAEVGEKGGSFVSNHLARVGKYREIHYNMGNIKMGGNRFNPVQKATYLKSCLY